MVDWVLTLRSFSFIFLRKKQQQQKKEHSRAHITKQRTTELNSVCRTFDQFFVPLHELHHPFSQVACITDIENCFSC